MVALEGPSIVVRSEDIKSDALFAAKFSVDVAEVLYTAYIIA